MNEWTPDPQFEESIRQSFKAPKIRTEFVDQTYAELMRHAELKPRHPRRLFGLRPAWTIALAILSLVIISTLVIGPQHISAAFRQLFGYIPGVGIVDQSSPIRILTEPVSISRDGITVSVNQGILTGTETRIEFGISGVPLSAYPRGEAVSGCIEHEYLRLPDGTIKDVNAVVPAEVNEATFVLPCIFNTLPGTVPTEWELPLRFVVAPADLTILPVIDVTPQVTIIPASSTPGQNTETSPTITNPTSPAQASVSIDKVIETEDGYILLGAVHPNLPAGSWLQITDVATIYDSDGKKVSYSFPNDVQPLDDTSFDQGGGSWVLQIKGSGVKFPLTIAFSGVVLSQVDPQASARTTINVGMDPQPEQVWEVNQNVQLAGKTIRLISITALSDGYSFRIDPGSQLSGVSVQIEGYQAIGGGGGGPLEGEFTTSLVYDELPKDQLTILFTNPLSTSPRETWSVLWQPETVREFPADNGSSTICLNAALFNTIPPIPAGLDGSVIITQMTPQLQIALASMDGSQPRVIAKNNADAALSLDGSRLAYMTTEGIVIENLLDGESSVIVGSNVRDPHWSPDGQSIAFVNSGDAYGIFLIDVQSEVLKQLSDLGIESIAGWSPDGTLLYYAISGSSGNGFQLRAVEVVSGKTQDLFVLENSSRKAPMPAASPDGKWIAYRASDNSSLYIKRMDGSPARLLLDNPATAINGIAWDKDSHWLGVSLITAEYPDGEIIFISPDTCAAYWIPGLSGELDGLYFP
jgi:hypothetical protein